MGGDLIRDGLLEGKRTAKAVKRKNEECEENNECEEDQVCTPCPDRLMCVSVEDANECHGDLIRDGLLEGKSTAKAVKRKNEECEENDECEEDQVCTPCPD